MNTSDLEDFATRYAAAWSGQDPEAFAHFYQEDGLFKVNDGEPAMGRNAVADAARAFMEAFPDMIVRLDRLERRADRIEFHWIWTGTFTGPGGNGAYVDMTGYEDWLIGADGLIAESLGHYDEAEYERQLSAGAP